LPTLLLGGGAGAIKGPSPRLSDDTPLANLYVTLLDKMGVPAENLATAQDKLENSPGCPDVRVSPFRTYRGRLGSATTHRFLFIYPRRLFMRSFLALVFVMPELHAALVWGKP